MNKPHQLSPVQLGLRAVGAAVLTLPLAESSMLFVWAMQMFGASQSIACAVTFFAALFLPQFIVPSEAGAAADSQLLAVVLVWHAFMVTAPLWHTNGANVDKNNRTIGGFLALCSIALHIAPIWNKKLQKAEHVIRCQFDRANVTANVRVVEQNPLTSNSKNS